MTDATENPEKAAVSTSRRWSVGEVIAWLTAGWFIIAFFLEWGYWRGFGISFEEIPLSVQHVLETALVWLPGFLLCAFGAFVYELFFLKNIGNAYDASDELPPLWRGRNNKMPLFQKWWHIFFPTVWGPWFVVLVVPFIIWRTGEISFVFLMAFAMCGWSIIVRIILNHTSLKILKGTLFAHSIFLVPGMAAFFFTVGYLGALDDSKDVTKKATVYLIGSSLHSEKNLLILRNTDEFIIAFDERARKISMIPHNVIRELSFHSDPNRMIKFFNPNQNPEDEISVRSLPRAPTPRH